MTFFTDNKLFIDRVGRLFSFGAIFETYTTKSKTRVELRMLKASAFIRSTPEWNNQLNDKAKCQEWTTQVKDTFNLTDKEVAYVFEELNYYALLKKSGVGGEELGAVDNVWIANTASDCELAKEFMLNAGILENDLAQAESTGEDVLPIAGRKVAEIKEECVSWLPTDFYVNDDGSVAISSYINNLHPTRYSSLYQSISKVFATCVPLLEQVTTDIIHPRSLRAEFDRDLCFERGVDFPTELMQYILEERPLPSGWIKKMPYIEPVPLSFSPSDRPVKPYSMHGMPLQASAEMASISLTPESPTHPGKEWQAVGRFEERVFAVGLYFYDVENVASPRLEFRDPVGKRNIINMGAKLEFCLAHDIDLDYGNGCLYSQEVGDIEIKSGDFICYPNYYQTKMPMFELADSTRSGHLKYIAFYVVDPASRLISTGLVPPQQPNWTSVGDFPLVVDGPSTHDPSSAIEASNRLRRLHAECNKAAEGRFSVHMTVGGDEDEYTIV
ncbi:hypothetical protein IWW39_002794 [Coemansia spiralis]|uniref:DUF4246 domain-containing protein n=1 Tax=Coemansia spiralis TaxID=417178 RepID=A0A9W8GKH8_9FUNG|nr:hypothetical protein IWW39_002794 [Coemansia spiralis]